MIRGDLSNRLIHLTRGESWQAAAETFHKIIGEGRLLGANGYIRGGFNCVCFSEAPLGTLAQALSLPSEQGMRYAPFGVMVSKLWLYQQGGRPVIYQPHDEFDLLHDHHQYRHVRYEPDKGIDHTWEREWRIQVDVLPLVPDQTTFVVPTRDWEHYFHQSHADDMALINYNVQIPIVEPPPWHFVVLEDLGLEVIENHA